MRHNAMRRFEIVLRDRETTIPPRPRDLTWDEIYGCLTWLSIRWLVNVLGNIFQNVLLVASGRHFEIVVTARFQVLFVRLLRGSVCGWVLFRFWYLGGSEILIACPWPAQFRERSGWATVLGFWQRQGRDFFRKRIVLRTGTVDDDLSGSCD